MRLIRMIGRDIRDAVKSVFRNFSLSTASISCITITLVLVSLAIILSYNVNNITTIIKQDFTIVAFMNNKADQEMINEVEYNIREHPNIVEYEFQSKTDIAKAMMEADETFRNIMERWDEEENPLKDVFLIKVEVVEKMTETAKDVEQFSNVSSVSYGGSYVEKFLSVFKIIEKLLLGAVIIFVIVTAFLINNTIKLTISARKNEIEIMRLVGASNFNIQLPFIVEGLFLGVLGSIIPIILAIYGYSVFYLNFDGFIYSPFMKLVKPEPFIYSLSLILLGIGILVGMSGSFRAVRKYLKI